MAPLAGSAWAARSGGRIGGAGFSAARSGAGSFGGSMAGGLSRGYSGGVHQCIAKDLLDTCLWLRSHMSQRSDKASSRCPLICLH